MPPAGLLPLLSTVVLPAATAEAITRAPPRSVCVVQQQLFLGTTEDTRTTAVTTAAWTAAEKHMMVRLAVCLGALLPLGALGLEFVPIVLLFRQCQITDPGCSCCSYGIKLLKTHHVIVSGIAGGLPAHTTTLDLQQQRCRCYYKEPSAAQVTLQ